MTTIRFGDVLFEGAVGAAGRPHGAGVLVCEKHEWRFDGEFQNGKRHGRGVWSWASGFQVEGTWRDGVPHGLRVTTYPDGARYARDYREGLPVGKPVAVQLTKTLR